MGASSSSPIGSPGLIIKRGSNGFPDAVAAADASGCEAAEGLLDKQSRRGGWQSRYFKVRDAAAAAAAADAAVGTAAAAAVRTVARSTPRSARRAAPLPTLRRALILSHRS